MFSLNDKNRNSLLYISRPWNMMSRYNLNWKNVVNNVDMSSLRAPWQNGKYKKPTHRTKQKHVEHQNATDI